MLIISTKDPLTSFSQSFEPPLTVFISRWILLTLIYEYYWANSIHWWESWDVAESQKATSQWTLSSKFFCQTWDVVQKCLSLDHEKFLQCSHCVRHFLMHLLWCPCKTTWKAVTSQYSSTFTQGTTLFGKAQNNFHHVFSLKTSAPPG